MDYRRLGKTGLKVSSISIGAWLTYGGSVENAAATKILREAVEHGINFIDTADVYARGAAEAVVGEALAPFERSDLVISSKVFWPMSDNVNDRGLSRKHIMESVEKSLRRLKTDYLDIYFCHRFDPDTPLAETARAMDDLVRQGKVLYWGTSVWSGQQLRDAAALADARGLYAPVVEQPRYNLLDRSIEDDVLPACLEHGMGVVAWSPLAGGVLTGKYDKGIPEDSRAATTNWLKGTLTEENVARTRKLTAFASDFGASTAQLALAWMLHKPGVSSAITGASKSSQLQDNLKAAAITLDDEAMTTIESFFKGT